MALSDTCSDVLITLKKDFVNYADYNYDPIEMSKIITAMYELSSFMVRQDFSRNAPLDKIQEVIDGVVVAGILDRATEANCENICVVLANVAKVNQTLKDSIENMIKILSSKERLLDVIKDPRLMNQLEEIKRLAEF